MPLPNLHHHCITFIREILMNKKWSLTMPIVKADRCSLPWAAAEWSDRPSPDPLSSQLLPEGKTRELLRPVPIRSKDKTLFRVRLLSSSAIANQKPFRDTRPKGVGTSDFHREHIERFFPSVSAENTKSMYVETAAPHRCLSFPAQHAPSKEPLPM